VRSGCKSGGEESEDLKLEKRIGWEGGGKKVMIEERLV
jgi:hypothetical protein